MIKIENTEVMGWGHAIRGMRNPMDSWDKSDSGVCCTHRPDHCWGCVYVESCNATYGEIDTPYIVGPNDLDLMTRLAKGGSVHAKYRRMITVYCDITAPLYWWKEFDTYKIGTVANSCSTMHKIHAKEFTLKDFSCEHLKPRSLNNLEKTIKELNIWRDIYLNGYPEEMSYPEILPKDKESWWQMIQLLPSSYNQRRTIMLNYEVLHNIYISRKDHKLDEWREFCKWIESFPFADYILKGETNDGGSEEMRCLR